MRRVRAFFKDRGQLLKFIDKHNIPVRQIMKMSEKGIEFYANGEALAKARYHKKKKTNPVIVIISICFIVLLFLVAIILIMAGAGITGTYT